MWRFDEEYGEYQIRKGLPRFKPQNEEGLKKKEVSICGGFAQAPRLFMESQRKTFNCVHSWRTLVDADNSSEINFGFLYQYLFLGLVGLDYIILG